MTIIICKVQSGMCNRIIPFITSYRLAMNFNLKYYLNWDDSCNDCAYKYEGIKTTYNDMFEIINNVNYINDNELQTLLNNKKIITINYCKTDMEKYTTDYLLQYDIIFFNRYVHPIFTKEDNISIANYSNIDWILNNTDYFKDIQKYFQLLKPVSNLQNKINEVLIQFPEDKNNIIGFHIRHWPDHWVKIEEHKELLSGNYEKRFELMDNAIKKNNNIKFYICSTNITSINELKNKYNERIIYFENRFGEQDNDKYYIGNQNSCTGNKNKNLNGVVDLFLLSKCNLIIGDVASSYSLTAPLLNTQSTYEQIKNLHL